MTFPMQCSTVFKNGYAVTKGHSSKIVEMSISQARTTIKNTQGTAHKQSFTRSCAGAGLKTYRDILLKFEFQKADKCCKGRYKLQEAIIVYQQSSKLAIIGDPTRTNTIISGWKLGDAQYQNVVSSCSLT
ncbi:hypothetical protein BGX24_010493 [Mortierella sp. AD032]|nr:hypothetical protein BGX24_010493 [Mortierella sp. AD032]